jgi:hypothetical protein
VNLTRAEAEQAAAIRAALARIDEEENRFHVLLFDHQGDGLRDVPMAKFLPADEFADRVIAAGNEAKFNVRGGIDHRYRLENNPVKLVEDAPWLDRVYTRFKDALDSSPPSLPISRYHLRSLVRAVEQARANLQRFAGQPATSTTSSTAAASLLRRNGDEAAAPAGVSTLPPDRGPEEGLTPHPAVPRDTSDGRAAADAAPA